MFFVCVSIWCVGGKFHSLFPLSFHAFSLYVCVRGLHFDVLDKKIFLPYFRSTLASFVVVSLLYSSFLFIALLPRVRVFVKVFWHLLLSCFLYEFSFYFLPVSLATSLGCCCFFFPPFISILDERNAIGLQFGQLYNSISVLNGTNFLLKSDLRSFQMSMIPVDVFHTRCAFGLEWKMKIISLFNLFLLPFISYTVLFDIIHGLYYTILTNFYIYLRYLQ